MDSSCFLTYAAALSGKRLDKTRNFLMAAGLKWDDKISFTVNLMDGEEIIATGSRRENILECFAVTEAYQGLGLTAAVLSGLMKNAYENGYEDLFIFTKPENRDTFTSLGFYPVASTKAVTLLENKKDGVKRYVASLNAPKSEHTGAIVMNCNPFTLGHLCLITTAARQCGRLLIFVVSEDKSFFSAADRLAMVQAGTAHIANVSVYPSGSYLISAATFPSYFLKETVKTAEINCELDLTIFSECFAQPLGIKTRFVGTEPNDPVTAAYNAQMKTLLPRLGISVQEIKRLESAGSPISASKVRHLMQQGDILAIEPLVPATTLTYVKRKMEPYA